MISPGYIPCNGTLVTALSMGNCPSNTNGLRTRGTLAICKFPGSTNTAGSFGNTALIIPVSFTGGYGRNPLGACSGTLPTIPPKGIQGSPAICRMGLLLLV